MNKENVPSNPNLKKQASKAPSTNSFQSLKPSSIKNYILKYSNALFKLFEAELFSDCLNSFPALKELKSNIYLLEFKFINFNYIDDIIHNISLIPYTESLANYTLKRLGYVLDKTENIFYLVYQIDSGYLLDLDQVNLLPNSTLAKLYIISNLVDSLDYLYQENRKLGFLHPNLVFYNTVSNRYVFIDLCFNEIVKAIDCEFNFHMINYLGFYDYEIISDINNEYNTWIEKVVDDNQNPKVKEEVIDKKEQIDVNDIRNINYFKIEHNIIATLIAYMFSNQNNQSRMLIYETTLFALQSDYYDKKSSDEGIFPNIEATLIDNKEIKSLLNKVLQLNTNIPLILKEINDLKVSSFSS